MKFSSLFSAIARLATVAPAVISAGGVTLDCIRHVAIRHGKDIPLAANSSSSSKPRMRRNGLSPRESNSSKPAGVT